MAENEKQSVWEKFGPIMFAGLLILSFAVGSLWQKVSVMEGSSSSAVNSVAGAQQDQDSQAEEPTGTKTDNIPQVSSIAEQIGKGEVNDHIRGSKDAQVFLIEYSDFECPYCARFHETAKKVVEDYDGKVAWIYRHYPIDSIHPNARPAAYASECVAEQKGNDAFWAFTDELFADPATLKDFSKAAQAVGGIDTAALQECVDSGKYKELVDEQFASGTEAGVRGTPGNFIVNAKGDTWSIPGAYPYDAVVKIIDEALAE